MRRRRSSAHRDSRDRGSIAVIVAAAFVPLSMALAVVADGGRVWVEKQKLKDDVEASARAVAQEWVLDSVSCSTSAVALAGAGATCSTSVTANGAVATVTADDSVSLVFAQLFGRSSASIDASVSVRVGAPRTASGLRPLALCAENEALEHWMESGMTSTATFTIGIETEAGDDDCGSDVSGNWGVLDLDGGSNSMSDAQNWIVNGYPGSVSVGETLEGDPGIPSPALDLDEIVGQSVVLPVFENPRLDGANAVYDVIGFVKVRIVSVALTGAASNRHVDVVFETGVVNGEVVGTGAPGFGLTTWSVCSLDGRGVCS